MAKQMMQDIVTNKNMSDGAKDAQKPILDRKVGAGGGNVSAKLVMEEPLPGMIPEKKEDRSAGAPVFSSLETSPIFEKMKKHNKDRESFSDEFGAEQKNGGRGIFGKVVITLGVILVVSGFIYGIFFYDAVLAINQKHADVALQNQEFTAGMPAASGEVERPLAFQLMTISEENSADLTATGEKNVTSKSSGKVVIYNNFGTQPQPLIKNTRFQTADGKIYRIHDSIVVPGQKTQSGKKVPGSLEVDVYADAAGTEYNIGLVDFTIPGFKGSPRYEKFYARSKTPMTGGFSGLMKVVSDADIQKAKDTLSLGLKDKLFAEALAQKPKGTVLYKDAAFYSFTDSMDNAATGERSDNKSVKITVKGSLTAALFNMEDLSKHIAKLSAASTDVSLNDRILVTNIEELGFAAKGANGIPPKEGDTFTFTLSGDAHAVWQVDAVALAAKLAGMKKTDYKYVFAEFSGIEKANAHIRPFWKTKFPSDPSKIRVEITSK
jgi:hypothetical protein